MKNVKWKKDRGADSKSFPILGSVSRAYKRLRFENIKDFGYAADWKHEESGFEHKIKLCEIYTNIQHFILPNCVLYQWS